MHIAFISPISWDNSSGAHRPVQLAKEFARRGHIVTYLEIEKSQTPISSSNPRILNLQDLGWDELNIIRAWYGYDYAPPPARTSSLLPHASSGIVICSAPFRPALEYVAALAEQGAAVVYDVLDDISEMRALGAFCYDDLAETYLAQNADLIVTLSPRLQEKFRAYPNVTLIRDGVDLAPFRDLAGLRDLRGLTHGDLTLGFWGTMWDYNLDIPLLRTLTQARPHWQWHFIGAYDLDPARPSIARALAAPNVHFHSSVPRQALAQYAQSFDVCILPVPVTPFNLARDPLKVYEYLACSKPVVATHLEQLAGMPYVYLSCSAEEFLSNVERAAQTQIDRAALDAYLNEQTWAKRAEQFLNALQSLAPRARALPPPPRGAMPNAENELDRWQAFARHLERLAQEQQAHIADLEHALRATGLAQKLKRAARLK